MLFPVFGQFQRFQRGIHLLLAVLPNPQRELFFHTAGKELVIRVLHDQVGQCPALAWGQLPAIKGDITSLLLQKASQDGQEGGLARSIVAQDTDHISSMGFKADVLEYSRPFLISECKITNGQKMGTAGSAFFFLVMLRVPLWICSPQPIGNACFLR